MCNLWICWTHLHLCRPPCWPQGSVSLWRNPGPLANVPPCQRQRGLETAGFGRLRHLQAIFQAIHLSGIIERPILSTPGGVTSYHRPPAPLLIKRDGRIRLRRIVKKHGGRAGGRTDGRTGRTGAAFTLGGEETTARRQIARCSLLTSGLRACEEIKSALITHHFPADSGKVGVAQQASESRGGGTKASGPSSQLPA